MPPAHEDARRPEKAPGATAVAAYAPAGGLAATDAAHLTGHALGHRRPELRAAGWRRHPLIRLIALTRPRQWVKNLLVIAAPAAAGVLVHDDVPWRVAGAFAAFCLLAAATYVVNDVCDAVEDRAHPRKRHRPVAAGEIRPRTALVAGAGLMLAGLGLCLLVRPLLLVVGAGYLAVTFSYTALWRRIAFVDVAAIAAGFVLRAVAGGVAAPVYLSRSFVLVVTFGAVFVAAGKRHAELARAGTTGRGVLGVYTAARLRLVLGASATLAFAAYCIWAVGHHPAGGFPWRQLTVLPFAASLARYGLLLGRGAGEAPEELLLEDRMLQLLGLAWTVAFALSVHAA